MLSNSPMNQKKYSKSVIFQQKFLLSLQMLSTKFVEDHSCVAGIFKSCSSLSLSLHCLRSSTAVPPVLRVRRFQSSISSLVAAHIRSIHGFLSFAEFIKVL